jgi:hypothetical protein
VRGRGSRGPLLLLDKIEHHPQLEFHDRLYLVKDNNGNMSGVFGPSLNGMKSPDIVVIGRLDPEKDIKPLKRLFDRVEKKAGKRNS